jgi:hypothetical protein
MMELAPLKYTLDNVVVGWREDAVSFAREHGYPLIVNSDQRPFYYSFGLQDIKSKWYEGIFDLGMRSLLPVPFDVETVGMQGGMLKVVTQANTKVLFSFKELHLFDADNCTNIGVEEIVQNYLVHDMFDITGGSRHAPATTINLTDSFVKRIRFVPSNRIDRNVAGDFKDIIVTSIISAEEIRGFECSETVVRILLQRQLKQHSIKQHDGRSLTIHHSLRHAVKNIFRLQPLDDLDKRIILHE